MRRAAPAVAAGRQHARFGRGASVLLVVLAVLLATGCGSSQPVDKGGFNAARRAQAQKALDTLVGTNITDTIVQLTATIGLPAVCRVHYVSDNPFTVDLVMGWTPIKTSDDAYTWMTAAIQTSGAIPSSLQLGEEPSLRALQAHYGVGYTRPFDPCSINAFGELTVLPWTGAYPATGKAAPKYND